MKRKTEGIGKYKSYFQGDLIIKKVSPYQYKVWQEFSYYTIKGGCIVVPKGFITDGASIPRLFWVIIGSPFTGRYSRAALVHDYLYHTQQYTRSRSDRIFLEAMKTLKVFWLKRRAMWMAVRTCAWIVWNKHKKELENV